MRNEFDSLLHYDDPSTREAEEQFISANKWIGNIDAFNIDALCSVMFDYFAFDMTGELHHEQE